MQDSHVSFVIVLLLPWCLWFRVIRALMIHNRSAPEASLVNAYCRMGMARITLKVS